MAEQKRDMLLWRGLVPLNVTVSPVEGKKEVHAVPKVSCCERQYM